MINTSENNYEKLTIAVEYLNLASELWLSNENLFCSANLAGAAEEISGQYCRLNKLNSERDDLKEIGERLKGKNLFGSRSNITGKRLANYVYSPKNSIKHMNLSLEDTKIKIDIAEEAAQLIQKAYRNFEKLKSCHLLSNVVDNVLERTTIYLDTNS